MGLDLSVDPIALTAALVDIPSVSRDESRLADEIEAALRRRRRTSRYPNGDAVLARTHLGRPSRVMLAGHIDTVPIADNLPSRIEGG
jgi:succinyl-diaminopimelate desuccinylase